MKVVILSDVDASTLANDFEVGIVDVFRETLLNEESASFTGVYNRSGLRLRVSARATGRNVRGFVFGEIVITRPDGREYRSYLHELKLTAIRAAKGV